jgi:hypothetical protein
MRIMEHPTVRHPMETAGVREDTLPGRDKSVWNGLCRRSANAREASLQVRARNEEIRSNSVALAKHHQSLLRGVRTHASYERPRLTVHGSQPDKSIVELFRLIS